QDILKEPLVLEFLGLAEQPRFSESELESAIINQIERFQLELGKGFLFEARQRRITAEIARMVSRDRSVMMRQSTQNIQTYRSQP
ncbi:MAG: PDDEXK nuclease domain-containing protein, partial [Candidatus Sericytochromatia bacterium]